MPKVSSYEARRTPLFVLMLAISLATTVPVCAELAEVELDQKAYQVYQQVFSPFCPGRSLNDCPSSKAHELKLSIRQQLEQGVPADVVLEQVFKQYGDQYRAVPPYAGFGRLVWWAPLGFLACGALAALMVARGRRRDQPNVVGGCADRVASGEHVVASGGGQSAQSLSDEQRREIERELSRLE